MAVIAEKENDLQPILDGLIYFPNLSFEANVKVANRESLKELVSYIKKLKDNHQINDEQFSELLYVVCANYIENEVEARVAKALELKFIRFIQK
jgi:hypothetical protein